MRPSRLIISLFFVLLLAGVCRAQFFPLPGSFSYSLNSINDVFDVSPDGKVAVALRNDPNSVHPAYLTTFDPLTGAQFDSKSFGFGPLGVRLAQVGGSLRAVVLTSQGGARAVTLFDVAADGKLTQLAMTTLTNSNSDSGSNIVLSGKAGVGFALVAGGPGKELVAFSLNDGSVVGRLGVPQPLTFSGDALEMVETSDNKRVLAFLSDLSTLVLVNAADPASMSLMGTTALPRNSEFSATSFAGIAFSADARYVFVGNGFTDFSAVDVTLREVVDSIGGNFRFGRARIFESGPTRLLAVQSTTSGTGAGQNALLLVNAADPSNLNIVNQASNLLSFRSDFVFSQAGDRLYVAAESALLALAVPGLTKIWEQPVPFPPYSSPSPKQVKVYNQSKEVIGAWEVSFGNFTSLFGSFPSDPPNVSVGDPAVPVPEGGAVNFHISLSAPTMHRITVDYTTSNETAFSPGDFEPVSGSLVFGPGEVQKTVVVQTINDSTFEFDETFKLNVAKTNVGTVGRSPAFVTILDDDPPPLVSVVAGSVAEGDSGTKTVTVEVVLSEVCGKPVTVSYATADGTANAGTDYAAASGQVTLNPGETRKTVSITVNGDAAAEADETVLVRLSSPVEATLGTAQAALTILNDDPKVQFGVTSVTVTEGTDLFATLNVTRSTDLSAATTVSYETLPGTASPRGDYTAAFGRLRFAPGEASKEIKVLITDDAYGEPQEFFTVRLTGAEGGVVGATAVATVRINSDEAADAPNPVREASFNAQFFVRQHYADFLGREPDADGLQFWTNQLTNCLNPPPADLTVCRVNVSAAFFLSIEFQNTGYLAYRTYKAAYGDATSVIPAAGGGTETVSVPVIRLNEFLPDTRAIGDGVVVNSDGWEQRLEANKQAYMLEFVQRARFQAAVPFTDAAQFVDKLFANAGVTPTQAERNAAITAFGSGDAAGRAAALRLVAENPTLQQAELRRAFVLMEYFGYLRRNPDDPQDVDFRGWKFWLDKLNEFNGDYVAAEMVKAFITSDEYVKRFGQ
ncbi:MAG TPA: Calx-beta domain-containing protein [Pyrinomonadaceae bacterium]|nr:Calx-beta domain-containing protein [Pyrinomonadaceae bacterium]